MQEFVIFNKFLSIANIIYLKKTIYSVQN